MRVKSFIVTNYNYLERETNKEIIKLEAKGNEIVDIKITPLITPFSDTDDCSLVTILYKQVVKEQKTDYTYVTTTDDTYTITLPPVQIPYEPIYTNDFIKITC